jgi:alpha-tubulin suppressor-like RCC1 family protein
MLCCAAPTGPPNEPRRVLGALANKAVTAVAAGREHALVATSDGLVYSFGGRSRALRGRDGAAAEPGLVSGTLQGHSIRHVAAGEVGVCCERAGRGSCP